MHGLERRPDRDAADGVTEAARWQAERFASGLGWITGPPAYGGRGLAAEFERLYWEREALYITPDLTPLNVGIKMLSAAILAHGSEFLRQLLLPALHRGDVIGCQLFSEPDAGSDLSAVRSSASLHHGVWELVGEKLWTSKAQFSDVGLCIVRTDVAQDPHDGLTMFLVDMHDPGVEVRPLRQMNGHASFNQVVLNGALVPDSYRLGRVGEGWAVVRTTLMSERAGVGKGAKDPAANALEPVARAGRPGGTEPCRRSRRPAAHRRSLFPCPDRRFRQPTSEGDARSGELDQQTHAQPQSAACVHPRGEHARGAPGCRCRD